MSNDRPLISYASPVHAGTGRTPIGILMFACSHLLLGGVMLLAAGIHFQHMPRGAVMPLLERSVPALVAIAAIPMLVGGVMLLLKGPKAWAAAIISFSLLAIVECIVVAHSMGMLVRYVHQRNPDASISGVYSSLAILLTLLCIVVLGYLTEPKSRATFALPPGEMHWLGRMLPHIAMVLLAMAVVGGMFLSRMKMLYPD